MTILSILRVAIGWHLLYEGLIKLLHPEWNAAGYLESATGPFAGFYQALAGNETVLVRRNGLSVGIGAHKIQTIKKCVELGLEHDFWMKTLAALDQVQGRKRPWWG